MRSISLDDIYGSVDEYLDTVNSGCQGDNGMTYVVKMDGEKVRSFTNISLEKVATWATLHCHGKIEITTLSECAELPHASHRIYPNQDLGKLVYKPFISLA